MPKQHLMRFIKRASKKKGLAPGSLVYVGEEKKEESSYQTIIFDETNVEHTSPKKIDDVFPLPEDKTTWLNMTGIHDVSAVQHIGKKLHIHPLIQEDILNTGKRPVLEEFEHYLFVIAKMLTYIDGELVMEQVSIVQGKSYVISFQEKKGDVFDTLRERINTNGWRARKLGSDYLAYALIDAIVDNYFVILEEIGERLHAIEDAVEKDPPKTILGDMHKLRRELIHIRRSIWPLRDVISKMQKSESPLITKETKMYLGDLYSHIVQIMDTLESFRDMISSIADLYLSTISNRMNEVMKVLTIFASIFIPLTFLAGVYGMNFDYMPELHHPFAYPLLWVVFIGVGGGMLYYFKKKGWL